jgi:mannitol-1-phosphate 5-dehydrogenase
LKEQHLEYKALLETAALIFNYNDSEDAESVQLQMMLKEKDSKEVVKTVTGLEDDVLITKIVTNLKI